MIPAGITTATVHLDAPISFTGEPGRLHVVITPSVSLIWTATGTPLGSFTDTFSLGEGVDLSVQLPHTDQPGFEDGFGNAFTGWYYTATVVYEKDGQRVDFPARDFQITSGQAEVDLALIPAGIAEPVPAVAPTVPVTSVGGFTGEVTLQQLGLDEVDNTSDVDKPLSSAQILALGAKVNKDTITVNVRDYGAVGDGIADDTAAIQAATNAAATFGLRVFFPKGRYRLTGQITLVPGTSWDLASGAVLDISGVPSGTAALRALGSWAPAVTLSADAAAGASTIQVTDAAGLAAGDRLKVSSSQPYGTTLQPRGEIVQIESVSGTTLTLTAPLHDSYPVTGSGQVQKMNPVDHISILGGGLIEGPAADTTKYVIGLLIEAATNVTLDISTRWCHQAGIYLFDVVGYQVRGGSHDDALLAGFGYGIALGWACQGGRIGGIRGSRVRHLVTVGGGTGRRGITRGLAVSHSVASQVFDAGFDVHPGGENITFTGCIVQGSKSDGFMCQGGKTVFVACVATDVARHGFIAQPLSIRGFDVAFIGCSVTRAASRGITAGNDSSGNVAHRVWTAFSVVGGSVTDTGSYGVSAENGDTTFSVGNISIDGVITARTALSGVYLRGTRGAKVNATVSGSGAAGDGIRLLNSPDAVVSGMVDVSTSTNAVNLIASPDCLISSARIKNPAGTGVRTDAASAGTHVAASKITATTRLVLAAGTTEAANA